MSNLVFMVLEMTDETKQPNGNGMWVHVEKAWIVGIAGGLAVQIFAGVWWASSQTSKLNNIGDRFHMLESQLVVSAAEQVLRSDKFARFEERMDHLVQANKELNSHLSVIEGWLYSTARGRPPHQKEK